MNIQRVERYKTEDGSLFEKYEEAENYQKKSDTMQEILMLLGGDVSTDFRNGKGFIEIDNKDFCKATILMNKIKDELGLAGTSRECHEDDRLGSLPYLFNCILRKDGKILRVEQPYFVDNFDQVGLL